MEMVRGRSTWPVRRGWGTRLVQGWRRDGIRRPQQRPPSASAEVPEKTKPSASQWHLWEDERLGLSWNERFRLDMKRSIFPMNGLQQRNKGPERWWSPSLDVFKAQKEEIMWNSFAKGPDCFIFFFKVSYFVKWVGKLCVYWESTNS